MFEKMIILSGSLTGRNFVELSFAHWSCIPIIMLY